MKKLKISLLALSVLAGGVFGASAAADDSAFAGTVNVIMTNNPLDFVAVYSGPNGTVSTNFSLKSGFVSTDAAGKIAGVLWLQNVIGATKTTITTNTTLSGCTTNFVNTTNVTGCSNEIVTVTNVVCTNVVDYGPTNTTITTNTTTGCTNGTPGITNCFTTLATNYFNGEFSALGATQDCSTNAGCSYTLSVSNTATALATNLVCTTNVLQVTNVVGCITNVTTNTVISGCTTNTVLTTNTTTALVAYSDYYVNVSGKISAKSPGSPSITENLKGTGFSVNGTNLLTIVGTKGVAANFSLKFTGSGVPVLRTNQNDEIIAGTLTGTLKSGLTKGKSEKINEPAYQVVSHNKIKNLPLTIVGLGNKFNAFTGGETFGLAGSGSIKSDGTYTANLKSVASSGASLKATGQTGILVIINQDGTNSVKTVSTVNLDGTLFGQKVSAKGPFVSPVDLNF